MTLHKEFITKNINATFLGVMSILKYAVDTFKREKLPYFDR